METLFCRGLFCSGGFEGVDLNPVFAMADFELRAGDAVLVNINNLDASPASFVLDFELDAGGAPPICVPTQRTPAPGAVVDNGRTDFRDGILWDFTWNECLGATDYDIEVARAGAGHRVVRRQRRLRLVASYVSCEVHPDVHRLGWGWRVRAHSGARFGAWSAPRPFDIERADSDPIAAQCP